MKLRAKPPIPFVGCKWRWREELTELAPLLPENAVVFDPFGGSGFLAHMIKTLRPDLRVIYNDFADYSHRIAEIPNTNRYRQQLAYLTFEKHKVPRKAGFDSKTRYPDAHQEVYDYLQTIPEEADWITISAWLSFTYAPATCKSFWVSSPHRTYYNKIARVDYNADGYLDGVTTVQMPYNKLLQFVDKDSVLLLDPPYVGSKQTTYKAKNQFTFIHYMQLLEDTVSIGCKYLFFNGGICDTLHDAQRLSPARPLGYYEKTLTAAAIIAEPNREHLVHNLAL